MMTTPVLFLIFNRPTTTKMVFEEIRKIKPRYLYVAADGPRAGRIDDHKNCTESRGIVLMNIDWDCEVKTLLRDENLGCGRAVSQAVTWFFDNVQEGIILEDDTVPDPTFFEYCRVLLNYYRDEPQVMHISGCYFFRDYEEAILGSPTYFFSTHIHVWGWATWKRAWDLYTFTMVDFTSNRKYLKAYYNGYFELWDDIYWKTYQGEVDTWDYQWMYSIFLNSGVAINPTTNLIKNIGFNEEATHTKNAGSIYNSIVTEPITNWIYPTGTKVDKRRDELYYKHYFNIEITRKLMFKEKLSRFVKKVTGRNTGIKPKISFEELTRLKVMPRYQPTTTTLMGHTFNLVDATTFLSSYHEIFEQQVYKFTTSNSTPIIIDCGANVGLATLYFKTEFPKSKVFSYEPDPNIFAALKSNMGSFGLENVEIFNEAIGTNREELLFNIEGGHSGMLVANPTTKTISVLVTPLKEIMQHFDSIDFLKIDIEGYEINVLPHIASELKKVNNLFLEYHTFLDRPQLLSKIIKIIEDEGFRYYIKEAAYKKKPFLERELFYKMDMLVNIFCYR